MPLSSPNCIYIGRKIIDSGWNAENVQEQVV